MIFIANTLVLNGGTTYLRRISRVYHERGHKVLIIVIQGPVAVNRLKEFSDNATVVMLDDLCNVLPCKLHSTASIFIPFNRIKLQGLVDEYGSHVHVMGVFGLFCALRFAKLDQRIRISAGIYQQNEYFLRGRNRGMSAQMISLFKRLPVENVINFNEHCVKEYSSIMGMDYLQCNIVPIGILPANTDVIFKPEAYRIVSVGNLVGFKKYNEYVIKLLGVLRNEFSQIRYDIYGEGPEHERLVDMAKRLGVIEHVTFHGSIPYAEFQNVVSTASVFIGSGTAILEAAILGVPSIIGIESIAEPVTYGFLYECEGLSYNEYMASKRTVPLEAKFREVFVGTAETVAVISERCRKKANEFTIDKTLAGLLNIEQGLQPLNHPMGIVDGFAFAFWLFITIIFDVLKIDRTFRYRRDLT